MDAPVDWQARAEAAERALAALREAALVACRDEPVLHGLERIGLGTLAHDLRRLRAAVQGEG
jgi:hypothetical protein